MSTDRQLNAARLTAALEARFDPNDEELENGHNYSQASLAHRLADWLFVNGMTIAPTDELPPFGPRLVRFGNRWVNPEYVTDVCGEWHDETERGVVQFVSGKQASLDGTLAEVVAKLTGEVRS